MIIQKNGPIKRKLKLVMVLVSVGGGGCGSSSRPISLHSYSNVVNKH